MVVIVQYTVRLPSTTATIATIALSLPTTVMLLSLPGVAYEVERPMPKKLQYDERGNERKKSVVYNTKNLLRCYPSIAQMVERQTVEVYQQKSVGHRFDSGYWDFFVNCDSYILRKVFVPPLAPAYRYT